MDSPYSTPHGLVASFGCIVVLQKYFCYRADDSWRQQAHIAPIGIADPKIP